MEEKENKKAITPRDILFAFIWFVALPGFFVWFIPFLLDNKIIPKGSSLENMMVPLMVVLILGTGFGVLKFLYTVVLFFYNKIP